MADELGRPEYLNWEDTDEQVKDAADKQKAATKKRAVAYHDVFAKTEAGNKILTEWIQTYCTGPVAGKSATDREVAMNDGKRELVNLILRQISIGETL